MESEILDLIVVGAGPTGIAIGAEARKAGIEVLLLDRGPITNALLNFPTYMTFFTTRDLLEIADIPMSIPHEKPTRRDALAYYRAVAAHYDLPVATHEQMLEARTGPDGLFVVCSEKEGKTISRKARGVALATGYFDHAIELGVPGEELGWVHRYYQDPYRHFNEDVVLVGGGNSACETALELYRNGAKSVTMVVRDEALKGGVKYWVRPDVENRIKEGAISVHYRTIVEGFLEGQRRIALKTWALESSVSCLRMRRTS